MLSMQAVSAKIQNFYPYKINISKKNCGFAALVSMAFVYLLYDYSRKREYELRINAFKSCQQEHLKNGIKPLMWKCFQRLDRNNFSLLTSLPINQVLDDLSTDFSSRIPQTISFHALKQLKTQIRDFQNVGLDKVCCLIKVHECTVNFYFSGAYLHFNTSKNQASKADQMTPLSSIEATNSELVALDLFMSRETDCSKYHLSAKHTHAFASWFDKIMYSYLNRSLDLLNKIIHRADEKVSQISDQSTEIVQSIRQLFIETFKNDKNESAKVLTGFSLPRSDLDLIDFAPELAAFLEFLDPLNERFILSFKDCFKQSGLGFDQYLNGHIDTLANDSANKSMYENLSFDQQDRWREDRKKALKNMIKILCIEFEAICDKLKGFGEDVKADIDLSQLKQAIGLDSNSAIYKTLRRTRQNSL